MIILQAMMAAPFFIFILVIISFVFWGLIFNLYNFIVNQVDHKKFNKIAALKYSVIMTAASLVLIFVKMATYSGPWIN